jgi:hypothetical protein
VTEMWHHSMTLYRGHSLLHVTVCAHTHRYIHSMHLLVRRKSTSGVLSKELSMKQLSRIELPSLTSKTWEVTGGSK